MADSNYNMIKPVEGLQNIAGLTPVKKREERKRQRKQKEKERNEQETENTPEDAFQMKPESKTRNLQDDSNSIDFCA